MWAAYNWVLIFYLIFHYLLIMSLNHLYLMYVLMGIDLSVISLFSFFSYVLTITFFYFSVFLWAIFITPHYLLLYCVYYEPLFCFIGFLGFVVSIFNSLQPTFK